MDDGAAVAALVSDLHHHIDQFKARGIKNSAVHAYVPSYYKRERNRATEHGGIEVVEFVRRLVHKAPSDAYKKLEQANCSSGVDTGTT